MKRFNNFSLNKGIIYVGVLKGKGVDIEVGGMVWK